MNIRITRKLASAAAIAIAVAGTGLLAATPAGANTLADVSWSVSNNQVGATDVQYTFSFTPALSGTIASVTMTVPATTGGTPTIVSNWGLPAGSVSLESATITYTVTNPTEVSAGTPIQLTFGGLTNPSSAVSATSTITTEDGSEETIDSASSPAVSFAATGTIASMYVAQSSMFSSDTQAFSFELDPALAELSTLTRDVVLNVQSNAAGGYTLTVQDTAKGMYKASSPAYSMPRASAGMATADAWPGANHFGYSVGVVGATLGHANLADGNFAGYTAAGEEVAGSSGPTGASAHVITLTNKAQINYATPAGTYSDTLTYTLTPSY